MKLAICAAALAAFLGMCTNTFSKKIVVAVDQTMEYQVDGDQYAVVIVQDGVSPSDARKMARQRAAEITVQTGNRYFTVDSEVDTQVIKSNEAWPNNQQFYGNMYQELIIEGDFNKERLQRQSIPDSSMYPATRLLFTVYPSKPRGKSIDACTLTDCNQ